MGYLGQSDRYTDLNTGISFASDDDAYRQASEHLVKVNALLADLRALEAAQGDALRLANEASGAPDWLITEHAQVLTDMDSAQAAQGDLRTFVDRYRVEVLGSGLRGMGLLPLVLALIGTVAAWIAWYLSARVRTDTARANLAQYVAEAQASGTLTQAQADRILTTANSPQTGLGDILGGLGGAVKVALVAGVALVIWQSRRKA